MGLVHRGAPQEAWPGSGPEHCREEVRGRFISSISMQLLLLSCFLGITKRVGIVGILVYGINNMSRNK